LFTVLQHRRAHVQIHASSIEVAKMVAAGLVASAAFAGVVIASDHMDTPYVEFNPRYDVNDVYAFPGSTPERVALVLGTSSPITPAGHRPRHSATRTKCCIS